MDRRGFVGRLLAGVAGFFGLGTVKASGPLWADSKQRPHSPFAELFFKLEGLFPREFRRLDQLHVALSQRPGNGRRIVQAAGYLPEGDFDQTTFRGNVMQPRIAHWQGFRWRIVPERLDDVQSAEGRCGFVWLAEIEKIEEVAAPMSWLDAQPPYIM